MRNVHENTLDALNVLRLKLISTALGNWLPAQGATISHYLLFILVDRHSLTSVLVPLLHRFWLGPVQRMIPISPTWALTWFRLTCLQAPHACWLIGSQNNTFRLWLYSRGIIPFLIWFLIYRYSVTQIWLALQKPVLNSTCIKWISTLSHHFYY